MIHKSIKLNAILNIINTLLSFIFPLITFPYVSRVLGVDNIGKINFSDSIIGYFALLASLGIYQYAIREGSRYKENSEKLSKFVSEIFSLNILFTLVSYITLIFTIIIIPKLHSYFLLIMISSTSIIFNTIGCNWLNSICENFLYTTVRNILVKIISIILMLFFVRDINDYVLYTIIVVFSAAAGQLCNYFYLKKVCPFNITIHLNLSKHIKPILIIFATEIAATIFVNSDMTLLGILASERSVGLYSVSTKLYRLIKNIPVAIFAVIIPRLSLYLEKGQNGKYMLSLSKALETIMVLVIPIIIGIELLGNNIIYIISGSEYLDSLISFKILGLAFLFSTLSVYNNYLILLPNRKENIVLQATIFAAIFNIVANIIFIPVFKQNAAAMTTLISEMIVVLWGNFHIKKQFKIKYNIKNLISILFSSTLVALIIIVIKFLISDDILQLIISIIISIPVYFVALFLLNNSIVTNELKDISIKVKNIFKNKTNE